MKKVIGILSIATLALAMFFSVGMKKEYTKDANLTSLLALNLASAVGENDPDGDNCTDEDNKTCYVGQGLSFEGCNEDTWYTLSDCY